MKNNYEILKFVVCLLFITTTLNSGFAGTIPISTVKVSTEGKIVNNSTPNIAYGSSVKCGSVTLSGLVDGNWTDSYAISSSTSTPYTITVDLGSRFTLNSASSIILHWGSTGCYGQNIDISVSADNSTFTSYGSYTWTSKDPCVITGAASIVRYIKITINSYYTPVSSQPLKMAEIEVFGAKYIYRNEAGFNFENNQEAVFYGQLCNGNYPNFSITNLWYTNSNLPDIDIIRDAQDYKKIDGWVMLYKSFGIPNDIEACAASNIPYFILYNKYKGLVRLFIYATSSEQVFEKGIVQLGWQTGSNSTGLLTLGSDFPKPYSQYASGTYSNDRFLLTVANRSNGGWVMAEFPVMYDPATSFSKSSGITFNFSPISNSTLQINGNFNFDIQTKAVKGVKIGELPALMNYLKSFSLGDVGLLFGRNSKVQVAMSTVGDFIKGVTSTYDLISNSITYFNGGGRYQAPTYTNLNPLVGAGELTMTGTISDIGTQYPWTFWNSGTKQPFPQDWGKLPFYNVPLGVFGLESYPTLIRNDKWFVDNGGISTNDPNYGKPYPTGWSLNGRYFTGITVNGDVKIAINPYAGVQLVGSRACLIASDVRTYSGGQTQGDLNYWTVDHLGDLISQNIFLANNTPENQQGYQTNWVDLSKFKGTTIIFPKDAGAKLYMKLQLKFRPIGATDNSRDIMQVVTYKLSIPTSAGSNYFALTNEQMISPYYYYGPYVGHYAPPATMPANFSYVNLFGKTISYVESGASYQSAYYTFVSGTNTLQVLNFTGGNSPDAYWNFDFTKSAISSTNDNVLEDVFGFNAYEEKADDASIDQDINVFPNPVINDLTISGINTNSITEIRDLSGRIIYINKENTENQLNIDMESFSKGTYIVRVFDSNKSFSKVIVKQ